MNIQTVEQSRRPTMKLTQNLDFISRCGGTTMDMTTFDEINMTVVEVQPCRKCNGNGSIPYRTTTYENIIFSRHAREVEKSPALPSTGGPPMYNYAWRIDCPNCVRGVPIPVPLTEVVPGTRAEMGIDHLI